MLNIRITGMRANVSIMASHLMDDVERVCENRVSPQRKSEKGEKLRISKND
ncbi:MAG: hypothetical protein CM15mP9_1280 [Methanobacteriota archaeon]|nr:MAG: hypothetical protein CM15mP9_1280 [Euryarchaeota archaeon]